MDPLFLTITALLATALSPLALKHSRVHSRLLTISLRCRHHLIRLFPEADSDLYQAHTPYHYQLWGKLGGIQTELLWHHTPEVEDLDLSKLPRLSPLRRASHETSTLYLSLNLGPCKAFQDLHLTLLHPPPESSTTTPPTFDQRYITHGDSAKLMLALPPERKAALLELANQNLCPMIRLTLEEQRLRATWMIDLETTSSANITAQIATLVQHLSPLFSLTPSHTTQQLLKLLQNQNMPFLDRTTILNALSNQNPDALRELLQNTSNPDLLLCAALHTPELLRHTPHERNTRFAHNLQHHPELSTRHMCLDALLHNEHDDHTLREILFDCCLGEQNPDLQARLVSRALSRNELCDTKRSALILIGNRLDHNPSLPSSTRVHLQKTLLEHTARPTFETYAIIARRCSDKILRYSSLQALLHHFPHHPHTVSLLLERAVDDPLPWISNWCRMRLNDFQQFCWRRTLTDIAHDRHTSSSMRLLAASRVPVHTQTVFLRLLSTHPPDDLWCSIILYLIHHHPQHRSWFLLQETFEHQKSPGKIALLSCLLSASCSWSQSFLQTFAPTLSSLHLTDLLNTIETQTPHRNRFEPLKSICTLIIKRSDRQHARILARILRACDTPQTIPILHALIRQHPTLEEELLLIIQDLCKRHQQHNTPGALSLSTHFYQKHGQLCIITTKGALEPCEQA